MSEDIEYDNPLAALEDGSDETETQPEQKPAKQESEPSPKRAEKYDPYKDETYRKLQSERDQERNRRLQLEREVAEVRRLQRDATLAKLSEPEKIAFRNRELEQELDYLRQREQERQFAEQREADIQRFHRISGAPVEELRNAESYEAALDIAESYASKKEKAKLEETREESAAQAWVGGAGKGSSPASRQEAKMDGLLKEGHTREWLAELIGDE